MSFAGLAYASIYLTARLRVFSPPDPNEASMWRMAVSWAPAALAAAVGISRTQDYWHHCEDVCAGAVIGLSTAALAFAQKQPLCRVPGAKGGGRGGMHVDYVPLGGGDGANSNDKDKSTSGGGSGTRDERGESDTPGMSEGHGSVGGHIGGGGLGRVGSMGGVRERCPSVHEIADLGSNNM
jgi:hypothetical protein